MACLSLAFTENVLAINMTKRQYNTSDHPSLLNDLTPLTAESQVMPEGLTAKQMESDPEYLRNFTKYEGITFHGVL